MKFTFAPESRPLDGYTIKRAIDRGGFGEVYYALADSGKEVALKLLQRNQHVELRGVSQCLNLKHPNLITLFDVRTDAEGDHWVVMEYMAGRSLEQTLADHPQGLPIDEVAAWFEGLCAGVAFLHDRGIVHRDLKPANIFRESGVVKIGDVGLSKAMTPSRRSAQTESVGTVYYMAPEVSRGKYGCELDVYSLGVILYEMLVGRVPFQGESVGEILMKHLTQAPDLAPLPARLRPIVARALEKDPQRRTPTASQLAAELRAALQGVPAAPAAQPHARPAEPYLPPGDPMRPAPPARAPIYTPDSLKTPPAQPATPLAGLLDWVRRNPVLTAVIVIAVLWLMSGGRGGHFSLRHVFRLLPVLALLTGVGYLSYRGILSLVQTLLRMVSVTAPPLSLPAGGPLEVEAAMPARPQTAPPLPLAPANFQRAVAQRTRPRVYNAALQRTIPARRRFSDMSWSMTMAVFWSVILTAAIGLFTPMFSRPGGSGAIDLGAAGLFGIVTIVASWGILVISKWWEGRGEDNMGRRLSFAVLGTGLGVLAYWLDEVLMVTISYDNVFRSLIARIGSLPLLNESIQPTLAGYMLFFTVLFGVRLWCRITDAFREKRFKILGVIWSATLAGLLPSLIAFPQIWAISWAAAISIAVQFSAVWVPPAEREALLEVQA